MNSLCSRRMMRKWLRLSVACFWAATLPWSCSHNEVAARTAAPRPALEEVASELICDYPQCSKESLSECTSCEYAVKYRGEIAAQLEQGQTKEQILNYFASTYGEHLLSNPRNWAAAGIPYLTVLFGLVPLALVLRSRQSKPKNHATPPVQSTLAAPKEDPRVEEALRDYDY